jgi:hypothetical protein
VGSTARGLPGEDEPVDLVRVALHHQLGDVAAHRPAEDVGPAQPEGVDEPGGVVGHLGDGQAPHRRRHRGGDAAVVEGGI